MYFACQTNQLPKKLFYGELQQQGNRSIGAQKKRYKGTPTVSLKAFNISISTRGNRLHVKQEDGEHLLIRAQKPEKPTEQQQLNSADRLGKTAQTVPPTAATMFCPHCQRTFRAPTGLTGYLRTYRVQPHPQDD